MYIFQFLIFTKNFNFGHFGKSQNALDTKLYDFEENFFGVIYAQYDFL